MRKRDLAYFRRLLKQKQDSAAKDLKLIEEHSMILRSADAYNTPPNSNHLPDLVSDATERERAFMFASRNGTSLFDIEGALRRMEEGTFGVCQGCGDAIPMERLEAVPNTTKCIACKVSEDNRTSGIEQ